MQILPYGYQKPVSPDRGAIVFPALEANWTQVASHNHDGINSALIAGLSLPPQAGNSGKFLTTNGVAASWAPNLPDQTGNAGKVLTTDGSAASWQAAGGGGVITVAGMEATVEGNAVGNLPPAAGLGAPFYDFGFSTVISNANSIYNNGTFEFTIPGSYVGAANGRVIFTMTMNINGEGYYLLQKDSGGGFVDYRYGGYHYANTFGRPDNGVIEFSAVANDKFRMLFLTASGAPPQSAGPYAWLKFTIDPK